MTRRDRVAEIEARLNCAYPAEGHATQATLNAFSRMAPADIDWLIEQLREARDDSARIDWLAQRRVLAEPHCTPDTSGVLDFDHGDFEAEDRSHGLREAIDAARESTTPRAVQPPSGGDDANG